MASTPNTPRDGNNDQKIQDVFENPMHDFQDSTPPPGSTVSQTDNLLICTACGTQYDVEDRSFLTSCRICDDPRQYVPASGQTFTTMAEMKQKGYKNQGAHFASDERFVSIWTEPKFAIGQRAILIKTPVGNVMWDCITFLDATTIEQINNIGGLSAIVISHPHFYTTHLEWAAAFDCPVYLSWRDKGWLNRLDRLGASRTFIEHRTETLEIGGRDTGLRLFELGGHFPGSLVCLAFGRLLVADTLMTTPAGMGHARGTGNAFAFMWSIPNMVPLGPAEIARMWDVLRELEFESTHGGFVGMDVWDGERGRVKARVLESMKGQVRRMGWSGHELLGESLT